MTDSRPDLARLLAAAADLRAAGASWDVVAARLGRSPATCRRWPARHPALWAAAFAEAERQRRDEVRAEATRILREQLRSADDKLRRDAAKALLSHAGRGDNATSRTADPSQQIIDGVPDAQLPDFTAHLTDVAAAAGG